MTFKYTFNQFSNFLSQCLGGALFGSAIYLSSCAQAVSQIEADADVAVKSENPPNIVLIMADDIGLGDIGYYHRARTAKAPIIETPNLDFLIQNGMRFSDAHSPASLCAPTRFSMLTGNFPDRGPIFGVWENHKDARIDPNFTTSARLAKAGGYTTAFFGKWGLGGVWKNPEHGHGTIDEGAMHYGFDYSLELPEGIQNSPLAFYENQRWMKLKPDSELVSLSREQAQFNKKTGRKINPNLIGDSHWDPAIVGPLLTRKTEEYIIRQSEDESAAPFFIYFSSQAVHIPHTPPATFNGKKIAGTTPGAHGDMIRELDEQVGSIIDALKKTGEFENTLLMFTSDNGGLNRDKALRETGHDSTNGLRGIKGSIYEGGHRVPLMAVWPNHIAANSSNDTQIVAHDIVATVAEFATQSIDRTKVLDSMSLRPILLNEPNPSRRDYMVHSSKAGPSFAIRQGNLKLIMKTPKHSDIDNLKPVALFDVNANLAENEANNLIDDPAYQDRIIVLLQRYKKHRNELSPTIID